MDLVVAGDALAGRAVHKQAVQNTIVLRRNQRQRSSDQTHSVLTRLVGEKVLNRSVAVGFAQCNLVGVALAHQAKVLGQGDHLGAAVGSLCDQGRSSA